jgi:hypothetical protein
MMNLLTGSTQDLWHEVVVRAERESSIILNAELETYLISLLIRYTSQPELVKKIFATAFLEAHQLKNRERAISLQHVGDQCLLFAGLFPMAAVKRQVKISYFVDLGRSAYAHISRTDDDLYWSLAIQFIGLMDVLQSIRHYTDLTPLAAFEQWESLGSRRALQILRTYSQGIPFKFPF